jgi:hypothetical protein
VAWKQEELGHLDSVTFLSVFISTSDKNSINTMLMKELEHRSLSINLQSKLVKPWTVQISCSTRMLYTNFVETEAISVYWVLVRKIVVISKLMMPKLFNKALSAKATQQNLKYRKYPKIPYLFE